jgi:hypothetical protein
MPQQSGFYALSREGSLLGILPATATREQIRQVILKKFVPDFFKQLINLEDGHAREGDIFRFFISGSNIEQTVFRVVSVPSLM